MQNTKISYTAVVEQFCYILETFLGFVTISAKHQKLCHKLCTAQVPASDNSNESDNLVQSDNLEQSDMGMFRNYIYKTR